MRLPLRCLSPSTLPEVADLQQQQLQAVWWSLTWWRWMCTECVWNSRLLLVAGTDRTDGIVYVFEQRCCPVAQCLHWCAAMIGTEMLRCQGHAPLSSSVPLCLQLPM